MCCTLELHFDFLFEKTIEIKQRSRRSVEDTFLFL